MNPTHTGTTRSLKSRNLKFALRADSGLGVGQVFPLFQTRNILGRSIDAAIPVDDSKASRAHASVDVQSGIHYLVDLGSTNGTYLNNEKINESRRLTLGDRIRIGSTIYVVELLDDVKKTASAIWREPTTAVLRSAVVSQKAASNVAPAAAAMMPAIHFSREQSEFSRWEHLLEKHTGPEVKPWLMVLVDLVLIAAAISF